MCASIPCVIQSFTQYYSYTQTCIVSFVCALTTYGTPGKGNPHGEVQTRGGVDGLGADGGFAWWQRKGCIGRAEAR